MKVICFSPSHSREIHRVLTGCDIPPASIITVENLDGLRRSIVQNADAKMLLWEVSGGTEECAVLNDISLQFPDCRILAFAREDRLHKIGPAVREAGASEFQCVKWHGSWPAYLSFWLRSWRVTIAKS